MDFIAKDKFLVISFTRFKSIPHFVRYTAAYHYRRTEILSHSLHASPEGCPEQLKTLRLVASGGIGSFSSFGWSTLQHDRILHARDCDKFILI